MKILHVAPFDAANAAWHVSQATNLHTAHDSRTLIGKHTNVAREADAWFDQKQEARALLEWAEVIVWHVGLEDADDLEGGVDEEVPIRRDIHQRKGLAEWFHAKPAVFWLNGSRNIRKLADFYRASWADIPQVATTPDLCQMFEAFWVPVCLPGWLDAGDYKRARMDPPECLHIVHCPTDRGLKNTAELEKVAVGMFQFPVKAHILSGYRYKQCLAYKAASDLHFDHMQGYYGMGSVEALAFGLPNLVHLDAYNRWTFLDQVGSDPPWLDVADEGSLRLAIEQAGQDRDRLAENGRSSRSWYEKCFSNQWKAGRWIRWLEATL